MSAPVSALNYKIIKTESKYKNLLKKMDLLMNYLGECLFFLFINNFLADVNIAVFVRFFCLF